MTRNLKTGVVAGVGALLIAAVFVPDVWAQRGRARVSVGRAGVSVSVGRTRVVRPPAVSVRVGRPPTVRYGYPGPYVRPRVGIYPSPVYRSYGPWYRGAGVSFYAGPYYGYYSPGTSARYSYGYTPADSSEYSSGYAPAAPAESPSVVEESAVRPTGDATSSDSSSSTASRMSYREDAEIAFREGDFEEAARLASHALVDDPENGKLHLFAAQTLFAVGDYEGAAAGIHQAADLLPANEWGHVVENYRQYYRGRSYVEQMSKLNDFIQENPDAAFALFVRGYQNGFLGHTESAIRDLKKVHELESRDALALELVDRFGGEQDSILPAPRAERDGGRRSAVAPALDSEPAPPEAPR